MKLAKVVALFTILIATFSIVVAQGTTSPDVPELTIGQALNQAVKIFENAGARNWTLAISLFLTLIVQIFKSSYFGGLVAKIPKKLRFLIPMVASFILGYVGIAGQKGWLIGLVYAIVAGPTSLMFHEILSAIPAYEKIKNS